MNMSQQVSWLIAAISLTNVFSLPVDAKLKINYPAPYNPLVNLMSELEITSRTDKNVSVEASYETESGLIKEIKSSDKSNSDPQNTSALIEYFLLQQPKSLTPAGGFCLTLNELTLPISMSLIEGIQQKAIKTKPVIFVRAVPAHVLNRYPDLFSKDEIFTTQNLRVLPASFATVEGLTKYRKYWIELFKNDKVPNKQDVLRVSALTDEKFQNIYVKP